MLRDIFANLFDWLERLESNLTRYLETKSSVWNQNFKDTYDPFFPKSEILVSPGDFYHGTTILHPNYFVFPLCDDSDPLPWNVPFSKINGCGLIET